MAKEDILKIVFGAVLAIFGGILGKFFTLLIEEWRQRIYIKTRIYDEICEIESILDKFEETFNSTQSLKQTYIHQLKENNDNYNNCKSSLYLIWNVGKRKQIINCYEKLKKNISVYDGKVESLALRDKAENQLIINKFMEFKTDVKDIKLFLDRKRFTFRY